MIKNRLEGRKRCMLAESINHFSQNTTAMIGLVVLFTVIILCICAQLIAPLGFNDQDISRRLQSPGDGFLLGTDNLGRDVFARLLYGGQLTLSAGLISVMISSALGIVLGSFAGYFGGVVDNIIMRIMDVFSAIPNLLLAITIAAALGPGIINVMIAVGISSTPGYARAVRGPILRIKGCEFVESARAIDANNSRIIFRHILPNVFSPIIVQATLGLATAILVTSSLSFLGLGIQLPQPEWGSMLALAKQYMRDYPYLVIAPGLAISICVLSVNLIGDGLRDAFDPHLKY